MRIKVNDTVEVISGNFKGVRGTVQRVYPCLLYTSRCV